VDIPVSNIDVVNLDDLVRLRQLAGPVEEYARVTVRATGQITVDENSDNALATNDLAMFAVELTGLPWWNSDADPAQFYNLFLRLHNDDPTDSVIFGYEARVDVVGGGATV